MHLICSSYTAYSKKYFHQTNNYSYLCNCELYVRPMSRRLLILCLLMSAIYADAQHVRLTRYRAPTALYLDAGRLFNYNLYEHARFEAGLIWVVPNEGAEREKPVLGQWRMEGYGAYGTMDRDFKYGGSVQLRLPGRHDIRLRLRGWKDLEQAASRQLEDYRMLSPEYNNSYLASRFCGVRGLQLSSTARLGHGLEGTLALRQSWEDYRFDNLGMRYPTLDPDEASPVTPHSEGSLRLEWHRCLTLVATLGQRSGDDPRGYMRALLQYDNSVEKHDLQIFAQAGYVTAGAPYSRMFDLSGTFPAPYFFSHTMLTVRPNRFAADLFTHACLVYTAPMPLWDLVWTHPRPFLQINAMWGLLHNADNEGCSLREGLSLQAPYMGVVEPATGFDGLLRWGMLDMGFGVAYQLVPPTAPYRNTDPLDNITVALVAKLIIA